MGLLLSLTLEKIAKNTDAILTETWWLTFWATLCKTGKLSVVLLIVRYDSTVVCDCSLYLLKNQKVAWY